MIGLPSPTADIPPIDGRVGRPRLPLPIHTKTIVGVAIPGVAPLAPGRPRDGRPDAPMLPPAGDRQPVGVVPPFSPPAFALAETPSVALPPAPVPDARSYQSAAIAIGGGLVLAVGAAAFAIFWRSPAPLRAEARVDSTGSDVLHMTCATCPDGTELRIGASRAQVTAQAGEISLPAPLKVGDNFFTVDVDRPGNGRDETVPLIVKIGYRIRPDPSQLDSDKPRLRLSIEGAPHATVVIGDKPLSLGADGSAFYDADISSECTGPAEEQRTVERSIPYSVAAPNGGAERGVVTLRVAAPLLHIDSPGLRAVVDTDHFLLAGRTGRGARLLAGDQMIGVAADGSFSRSIAVAANGTTELRLRAQLPGQAPRIVNVQVKRVERLADEARDFANGALSFPALMEDVSHHVGEPVALTGEVVEARAEGARTLALLDVKGCASPPCLARALAPGVDSVARGDVVDVYGYVTGSVGQGDAGPAIAEIESAFVIKSR